MKNSLRGKELNKFCPQTAATTFAFSSVFILLLCPTLSCLAPDGAGGHDGTVGIPADPQLEVADLVVAQVPVQLRIHQVQATTQHAHPATVRRHLKVFLLLRDKIRLCLCFVS